MTIHSPSMDETVAKVRSIVEQRTDVAEVHYKEFAHGACRFVITFNGTRDSVEVNWSHVEQRVFIVVDQPTRHLRKRCGFSHVSQVANQKRYWQRIEKFLQRTFEPSSNCPAPVGSKSTVSNMKLSLSEASRELALLRNEKAVLERRCSEAIKVAAALRQYVDAIPKSIQFDVSMPGLDRDWVDSVLMDEALESGSDVCWRSREEEQPVVEPCMRRSVLLKQGSLICFADVLGNGEIRLHPGPEEWVIAALKYGEQFEYWAWL